MSSNGRQVTYSDDTLAAVCAGERKLLMDGAFGTMLQEAGLAGVANPPDLLNLSHAEDIESIQRAYVEAGCDAVSTATFNSSPLKLAGQAVVKDIYEAAVATARAAGARYIAGDMGPTGELLEPWGDLSKEEAYEAFAEQARCAEAAGCDFIIIETMTDLNEALVAAKAAIEQTSLPVFVSMTFGKGGRTMMGNSPAEVAAALSDAGVQAVGFNCSLGPDEAVDIVTEMRAATPLPLIAQPNAGLPELIEGRTVYSMDAESFTKAMGKLVEAGASIIGSCCGSNPAFTAALRSQFF